MERSRRYVLLLAALIPITLSLTRGHDPSMKDGNVVFLPYSTLGVTVNITGDVRSRGVYRFDSGADIHTVINMTGSAGLPLKADTDLLYARLHDGDSINISTSTSQHTEIGLNSMKTRERMLLGIPLQPDRMDYDDWRCLPGVGPVLAKNITDDRQINGDFGTLKEVGRVPGIGERKINRLRKYF